MNPETIPLPGEKALYKYTGVALKDEGGVLVVSDADTFQEVRWIEAGQLQKK